MPFYDESGLPKDIGASDWQDSCRLAGVMAMIGHQNAPDMTRYLTAWGEGVRCPLYPPANNPKNFSRDQEILLAAGLYFQKKYAQASFLYDNALFRNFRAQNTEHDYPGTTKKSPDGPDIYSPSAINHLRLCTNVLKGKLLGKAWLVLDILYNALFTPLREPNQLIAMCAIAGAPWVKFYKIVTPKWREAIREYWSGWRGEPELAKDFITFLEKY